MADYQRFPVRPFPLAHVIYEIAPDDICLPQFGLLLFSIEGWFCAMSLIARAQGSGRFFIPRMCRAGESLRSGANTREDDRIFSIRQIIKIILVSVNGTVLSIQLLL